MSRAGEGGGRSPRISVAVVNFNGGDYLRECLRSLARQTFTDFETLVVDNASTDGSLELIEEAPSELRILRQDANLGFAAANNIAAKAGRGEWLALLNPDAVADPDWLEALLRAVSKRPTHRLVASVQIDLADSTRLDGAGDCYSAYGYAWRGGYGAPVERTPDAGDCFAPCGAAAFYPRERFLEAGGFESYYFCYHEDVDLGFRMRLLGERCQFDPTARVRHAGSAIAGKRSAFAIYHGIRNGVWTYVRNMPAVFLAATLPVWAAGALALLIRGALVGQFAATLRGFWHGLARMGPALRDRRRIQRARTASLGEVAAALAWNPFDYVRRRPVVRPFSQQTGAEDAGGGAGERTGDQSS
ncbi:glycosyltransferase [bacterium]|nr:glycosyltransferase [bacterium]